MSAFGWPSWAKPLSSVCLLPLGEELSRRIVERGELGVAEDGGFDFVDWKFELSVAGTVGLFEQCGAYGGKDFPVFFQTINVAIRNTAAQMPVNVLRILRLGAVDVPREVEVVVVLCIGDFTDRYEPGVPRDLNLLYEGINDLVDVLFTEAIFVAIFDEAFGGVDQKDALAGGGTFLVEHDYAGGNAGAEKEVWRKANDALNDAALD
jgi:hypothetical protein